MSDYVEACGAFAAEGARRFLVVGDRAPADALRTALRSGHPPGRVVVHHAAPGAGSGPAADVVVGLAGCDRGRLQRAVGRNPRAHVLHAARREPFLGVVALHKSGTNLVAELVRAMGYDVSGEGTGPAPYEDGLWEKHEEDHLATLGPGSAYVVHSLPMPAVGGPAQYPRPLFYAWCEREFPVVFHYRDPRAVVLSLIRYLLRQGAGKSFTRLPFHMMNARMFERLPTPERRLSHAIRNLGPYLEWSFTDNAWLLDHPDVFTTSYEELVGGRGGGDDGLRENAVARLMVLLGVCGDPSAIGERAYNPSARTFVLGQAHRWRDEFPEELLGEFQERYSTILDRYGYAGR
ncbi:MULTISPECIES: hypothetical protein [Streptosporangium]|uniref:Sulfotransferase domain-containing protein n=1 Tax=Streptosporangium brasiliense TaxID=47480 RepID=A0ABT9R4H9_9ACTN|nr:hypothetical protein [Streptosporangium brasiliense]MDP9863797.1 hypothetical protein [Streptosporangium brasiliense]